MLKGGFNDTGMKYTYCTSIYENANQTTLQKLEKIQKKAIRTISNAPFRAHTAPLFKHLQILTQRKDTSSTLLRTLGLAILWIVHRDAFLSQVGC